MFNSTFAFGVEKLKFDYQWLIQPLGSQYKTEILVDVHVPVQQEIQYIPGVLETLKNAWTQYLALLVPLLVVFWAFVGFLLRNQLLETSIASDLLPKKEKMGMLGHWNGLKRPTQTIYQLLLKLLTI